MKRIPLDIIGDIAILKFSKENKKFDKLKYAKSFLSKNKNIRTILEKTNKISGRLRKAKTNYLAGENKKQTIYRENNCLFKLNIDETYFSPRLSNHRKEISEEIAKKIKKNSKILVMFAGIAPLPIVLARTLKEKNKLNNVKIISNEINKKASKYAEENTILNKFQETIKIIQCDAKNLPQKLRKAKLPVKYDFILMPRPNLKETFLKTALTLSAKNTCIYYHGFGTKEKVLEEIENSIPKNKISKIKIEKAGEIAPHKFRWIVKFRIK